MNLTTKLTPALALLLVFPLAAAHAQYPQNGGQYGGQGYAQQQGDWDTPPAEYQDDVQRRGFHDGIEAARADFTNRVQSGPERHSDYRHPHVPYAARDTYRNAYKRGYFVATQHMQEHQDGDRDHDHDRDHDRQQPNYQGQQGGWDAIPGEYANDLQRHAFHDGIEAARADFQNRVQPNPEGHEEFRHPQVDYPARDTYREAYKRGYFIAIKHMQEEHR